MMRAAHLREVDLEALAHGRDALAAPGARAHAQECAACGDRLTAQKILAASAARTLEGALGAEASALDALVARAMAAHTRALRADARSLAAGAVLGTALTVAAAAAAWSPGNVPSVGGVVRTLTGAAAWVHAAGGVETTAVLGTVMLLALVATAAWAQRRFETERTEAE